jgi:hypothetical protein
MLVLEKILVPISYRNITHYRKLGYSPVLNRDLEINTTDLPSSSHVKVFVKCEICHKESNLMYCKYIENKKRYGFYGCKGCSRNKAAITSLDRYGVDNYSKTDEWKKRVSETNIKKYGYKTNLLNPDYQDRIKSILKSKYNSYNFFEINRMSSDRKKKYKFKLNDSVHSLISDLELVESRYSDIYYESEYLLYRSECRRLTSRNVKFLLENWNGKDYYDGEDISNNFILDHNDPKYPTIDHKISIYHGYVNGLSPLDLSNIDNLCITKRSINSSKRDKIEDNFN